MLFAQLAIFCHAHAFCAQLHGLLGNQCTQCELVGRLFVALSLVGLCSDISFFHWMHGLDTLKDCHEGLNPFGVVLVKQVSLILPLQQADV